MNYSIPPAVRAVWAKFRTQGDSIRRDSVETHNLQSLSQRILLSRAETLEQVAAGHLLALDSRNGKYSFSTRSLDALRNAVVDFIAGEIVTEMSRRGADEHRVCMALQRAFEKQYQLSRRQESVVEFARTPQDNDDDDFYGDAKKAAGVAAGVGAGYLGYRYLKNRGNGGNALPGASPRPQLPPGPSGDSQGARHPGPPGSGGPSVDMPITTASSTTRKTIGNSVVDPLASAVATGRKAIAKKGSAIWQALRGVPL